MTTHAGIEAIALAVPHRYLALEELARARGVEPAKYVAGLGAREMAVPVPGEDTVALAATAAARLIRQSGVDVSRVGMLVVGTETGVDHSKPVASFVQGLLGLPRTMRTYDTQHACYGGTAALMAAVEWIASGAAAGRSAIVICADVARYGLNTAGEPTQGAGAVAMLVSSNPLLLRLDVGITGLASNHVHDFWRPLGQREAEVDGKYSIGCYLDAVSDAYRGWRSQAVAHELIRVAPGQLPSEALPRLLFHVPFCKMAKKAHAQVRRVDLEDAQGGSLTAEQEAAEAPRTNASYAQQVAPSLGLSERVGNIYTGSLYLSLAGLLHAEAGALANQRIGLFSYGSGCASEFFSGVVGADAARQIARAQLDDVMAARTRISVEAYERIMNLPPLSPSEPDGHAAVFRFTGVVERQRQYARPNVQS